MTNAEFEMPENPVPNPVVTEPRPVNPFKVALCISVFMACVGIIVTGNSPVTLQETLTFPLQLLWSILGMITSASILVGVFWTDRRDGLLIELPGLFSLGLLLAAYGTSIYVTIDDPIASLAAPLSILLGVACEVRVYQIAREMLRADRAVRIRENAEADVKIEDRRARKFGIGKALRREQIEADAQSEDGS